MEENKYYTPEIEEFFVGFECELKNSSHDVNFEWEKFKITGVDDAEIGNGNLMDWSFYDSRNAISEKSIRVKYLDREDIESLGWKPVDKKNSGKKFYEGVFENSTRGLMYFEHDWLNNKITIKHPNYFRDGSGRFDGFIIIIAGAVIKNKLELSKLMKMLQITK